MDAMEHLEKTIIERSEECEREIFAMFLDPFTGAPAAALALVAPDCVVYTRPLIPERKIFIDICLN